ncbi:uncharacterized protein RHOBADRAFT_51887 [Rhodotorula graminis WP1]|uniref:Proteophosphoglycan ppg4 n=1 Tax=Rhodotorula graminis (strain WP1) TaxID=578459 RepID=A0A194S846_RHOGW|nr:uncharacterized protein RHOBADRAFT_51887 [Rhodotorula graminis WP1]KPV76903.1 hypothetical protein RHOBADRAFT_51887 [Rhodotorula graminis WP1]
MDPSPSLVGRPESLNRSLSLADLDPYASAADPADVPQVQLRLGPATPFTKAFGAHDRASRFGQPPPLPVAASPPPLIDICGPTPPRPPPFSSSNVRRPSPLKFSFFDDSFDSGEITPSTAPFANLSPPPTVRRLSPSTTSCDNKETENEPAPPVQVKPAQRRWSAMTRLQEERRKAATLAPVQDCSPIREGDSSMILSTALLGADDLSLLADEGGSFLFRQQDVTLDSFAVPQTASADNSTHDGELSETSGGMSVLLHGLGESMIDHARLPTSSSYPSPPSILPSDLTSSTRTITGPSSPATRARQVSATLNAESSFFALSPEQHASGDDVSFLNASTASFAEYRDSPVKPRVASLQVERWLGGDDDEARTPRPGDGGGRVADTSASSGSGSGTAEGPSQDSFDLTRWGTAELGTGILDQSPPTAMLKPESTKTLELSLQSPIQPTKVDRPRLDSSTSTLACSTRTVTELGSFFDGGVSSSALSPVASSAAAVVEPVVVAEGDLLGIGNVGPSPQRLSAPTSAAAIRPPPSSVKETGAERLKRRLDELRAQKKAGPSANDSARSSAVASSSATPCRPVAPKAPSTSTAPVPRLARPRPSMLPGPTAASSTSSGPARTLSSSLSEPPKTPGERKDSTAVKLERLRSERKQRELARATPGPSSSSSGMVRSSSATLAGKPGMRAPATVTASSAGLASRRSMADLSGAASSSTSAKATSTGGGLVRSRSLVAPSSRPLLAATAAAPASRASGTAASTAPRKSLAPRSSLLPPASSSSGTAHRRLSTAPKLESTSAPQRARVPLGATQPAAQGEPSSSSSGARFKPRVSRIGTAPVRR